MPSTIDIEFVPVKQPEQIAQVANLAEEIWQEHFVPIIGQEATDYLCRRMLSIESLIRAIADEGYEYYFTRVNGIDEGFIGIVAHEDCLFLSKLYLRLGCRGKGYGRAQLEYVKQRAIDLGFDCIRLTCNRENIDSIEVYKHVGFEIIDSVDIDCGEGFWMNDYVMEWKFA